MKHLLYILVFTAGTITAQTDSTHNALKFGLAANSSIANYGFTNSLLATISNNKHQFDLGPKFSLINTNNYKNQFGVEFNYRFFPNGMSTRFNSFLLINADFFNRTLERSYDQTTNDPLIGGIVSQRSTRRYYALNLGYGIRFRIVDKLYVASNIGIGVLIEDYDDTRTSTNSNLNSYKGYVLEQLGASAAIILGFNF